MIHVQFFLNRPVLWHKLRNTGRSSYQTHSCCIWVCWDYRRRGRAARLAGEGDACELPETFWFLPAELDCRLAEAPRDALGVLLAPSSVVLDTPPHFTSSSTGSRSSAWRCCRLVVIGRVKVSELSASFLALRRRLPARVGTCLLYTSPSPRDRTRSRMPSSA